MIISAAVLRRCNCVKVGLADFLTPTDAVTENPKNYFAAENITNSTGWDGVKKYYSRQLRL